MWTRATVLALAAAAAAGGGGSGSGGGGSGSGGGSGGGLTISGSTVIVARWWRLTVYENNGSPYLGVGRIALKRSGVSLDTTGKTYAASAVWAQYVAQYGVANAWDGVADASSYWAIIHNDAFPHWASVDMGRPVAVDAFTIQASAQSGQYELPKLFMLEYSNDGQFWLPAGAQANQVGWNAAASEARSYPVTEPANIGLTASSVLLALRADDPLGGSTFTDSSPLAHAVTTFNGSPAVSDQHAAFGGKSILLPGPLSSLAIPSGDFQFGVKSAFSISMRAYVPAAPPAVATLIALGAPGAGAANAPIQSGWGLYLMANGSLQFALGQYGAGYNTVTTAAGVFAFGSDVGLEVSFDGYRKPVILVNRVAVATTEFDSTSWASIEPMDADASQLYVGRYATLTGEVNGATLYLDHLEVTLGARHLLSFDAEGEVGVCNPYRSISRVMLPLSSAVGSSAITDLGTAQLSWVKSGDADFVADANAYGGTSLHLGSTGSVKASASTSALNHNGTDFELDFTFQPDSSSGSWGYSQTVLSLGDFNGSPGSALVCTYRADGTLEFSFFNSLYLGSIPASAFSTTQPVRVTISLRAAVMMLFGNGVKYAERQNVSGYGGQSSSQLILGACYDIGSSAAPGKYSQLRLILGSSINRKAFTPPALPLDVA